MPNYCVYRDYLKKIKLRWGEKWEYW
jgi:hypothetical protein